MSALKDAGLVKVVFIYPDDNGEMRIEVDIVKAADIPAILATLKSHRAE